MTKIFDFIEDDNIGGIKNLIKDKVNLNQKDGLGQTSLHLAVNHENKDVIELLIVEGADVNVIDNEGESPIFMVSSDNINLFKLLLVHGADPNIKNNDGRTILDKAYEENLIDIIVLLKSYGAKSTIKPSDFGLPPD